jgi:hypothetical protein
VSFSLVPAYCLFSASGIPVGLASEKSKKYPNYYSRQAFSTPGVENAFIK